VQKRWPRHHAGLFRNFFRTGSSNSRIGPITERDKRTGEKLLNLWINFVKTGNPTPRIQDPEPARDPLEGFVWEQTKKHSRKYA
jgi:hypothetical protein